MYREMTTANFAKAMFAFICRRDAHEKAEWGVGYFGYFGTDTANAEICMMFLVMGNMQVARADTSFLTWSP
jgi:hypothetical protein